MSIEKQWFELSKADKGVADLWWTNQYQPYLKRVKYIVRQVFKADSYYHQPCWDGTKIITGIYFARPPVKYWKETENCRSYVPSRKNIPGKLLDEKFKTIEKSPVLFQPLRKKYCLPDFWLMEGICVFLNFRYYPNKGVYVQIPLPHAVDFAKKNPQLKPVCAIEMALLEEEKNDVREARAI